MESGDGPRPATRPRPGTGPGSRAPRRPVLGGAPSPVAHARPRLGGAPRRHPGRGLARDPDGGDRPGLPRTRRRAGPARHDPEGGHVDVHGGRHPLAGPAVGGSGAAGFGASRRRVRRDRPAPSWAHRPDVRPGLPGVPGQGSKPADLVVAVARRIRRVPADPGDATAALRRAVVRRLVVDPGGPSRASRTAVGPAGAGHRLGQRARELRVRPLAGRPGAGRRRDRAGPATEAARPHRRADRDRDPGQPLRRRRLGLREGPEHEPGDPRHDHRVGADVGLDLLGDRVLRHRSRDRRLVRPREPVRSRGGRSCGWEPSSRSPCPPDAA